MMSADTPYKPYTPITNEQRAAWALNAVMAFKQDRDFRHLPPGADLSVGNETLAEAAQDLVSDLMHFMERIEADPIALVENGIGCWAAERENPDPQDNKQARVTLATTVPQTVWLAKYDTAKFGINTCVFFTEEAAYAWKDEIAREETASDEGGPLSGDDYFEKMEAQEREWFSVETSKIIGFSPNEPRARIVFPSRENHTIYVGVHDNKEGIAGVRAFTSHEPAQKWRDEIARVGWEDFNDDIPVEERTTDAFFDISDQVYFNLFPVEIEGALGVPTVWSFEVSHDYNTTVDVYWNRAAAYAALAREIDAYETRHGPITSQYPAEDGPAPETADELLEAKARWLCEQDDDYDHLAVSEHPIMTPKGEA